MVRLSPTLFGKRRSTSRRSLALTGFCRPTRWRQRDGVEDSPDHKRSPNKGDGIAVRSAASVDLWADVPSGLPDQRPSFRLQQRSVGKPDRTNRVSRFTVARQAPHSIDSASEHIILEWKSAGHDGGDLAFGLGRNALHHFRRWHERLRWVGQRPGCQQSACDSAQDRRRSC